MILISHRGNIKGKYADKENHPSQIDLCASLGYEIEIDIRLVGNKMFLGHDTPDYEISLKWLESLRNKLWIHCKNTESLQKLSGSDFNYFWHDKDDYTLTSKGIIWAYPGKPLTPKSIAVLPELWTEEKHLQCLGVCSDFVCRYR